MKEATPGPAGHVITFEGRTPKLGRNVFIAPGAAVIGDVELGDEASVWFNCTIRGDEEPIRIGARTNIQDGVVIHTTGGVHSTTIGESVVVGHGAILHGCTIEDGVLIGIGAIVLDGAVIESGAVVAAGAVVPPGKRVGGGEMWAGCPAKMLRPASEAEAAFIVKGGEHYVVNARAYLMENIGKP